MRERGIYAVAAVLTIALGLASRSGDLLPEPVAKTLGDALYAVLVFLLVACAVPRATTRNLAVIAFAICAAVEASQAVDTPWLDAARDTWLGRHILGESFAWLDLARYAVGIAAVALIRWRAREVRTRDRR